MSKWIKRIGLGLLAVLIIIQFFGIDKENPAIDTSKEFMLLAAPPADVAEMIKTACYDCHSHESQYPWYTSVAPISWWISHHIEEGRAELNFSTWGEYPAEKAAHKAEEAAEEIEEKHMPIKPYLITHGDARLTAAQRERLSTWFFALADTRDVTEKVREVQIEPAIIEESQENHGSGDYDNQDQNH
jgi:hypothetical protein